MGSKGMKSKPYRTRYAGAHRRKGRRGGVVITLPFDPRKGKCEACGKSKAAGEIKSTHLHHWWYSYAPKTVKQNPILVLENTSELCFYCHALGDAIRTLLYASPKRVAWVAECLKGEQRERFIKVLNTTLKAIEKIEKNINKRAKFILELTKK